MTSSTSQVTNKRDASSEVVNSSDLAKAKELSKKARDLAEVGKLEEAIALFEEALAIYPNVQVILTTYAKIMRSERRYKTATSLLERSISINPNDLGTIIGYSKTLNAQKKFAESLEYLEHRLKVFPESLNLVKLIYLYANTAVKVGQKHKAIKLFERSLQLSWHNKNTLVSTLTSFGNLLMQQQEYEYASELFKRAILVHSENNNQGKNSFLQILINRSQFNDYNRKVPKYLLEKALLQGPIDYHLVNNYMNALVQLGKYQIVVELFENYLQNCDDFPILNFYVNSLSRQ